ncbi:MAG: hypothetical protein JOY61_24440 [Chloroflexi bacterium]|nr:hypothetical protein [Chloroflexota bacterium]
MHDRHDPTGLRNWFAAHGTTCAPTATERLRTGAARTLGPQPGITHNLGYVMLANGDARTAYEKFSEAMAAFRRAPDTLGVAECVIGLGLRGGGFGSRRPCCSAVGRRMRGDGPARH